MRDSGPSVNLFAGAGGWCQGARILGMAPPVGFDLSTAAIETARQAGFRRTRVDVATLDPRTFAGVRGLIASPPCPTFSDGGKRTGTKGDYQRLLDVITCLGEGCEECWPELAAVVVDPRTALAAEVARWSLLMPDLEWIAAEQVPALEYCWEDISGEWAAAGWEDFNVFTIDALDLGLPSRRRRTFLIGRRTTPAGVVAPYGRIYEPRTVADVLGWGSGHRIRTRSNRRPTGGNLFSADGPAWCLTEQARSWERDADGLRLTAAEAGLLNGFPIDYPWRGSRTAQFRQIADVVAPPVAAAVLGAAAGIEWRPAVDRYLQVLYCNH